MVFSRNMTHLLILIQASIRAAACWFNISCSMGDVDMEDPQNANQRDEMIKGVTNENTKAIRSARESMSFENLESLEQGAGTLYAITVSNISFCVCLTCLKRLICGQSL